MDSNRFIEEENDSFDIKKEFYKYFFYWKYFVLAIVICLSTAFIYIKYAKKIYETTAKIKILDKKDSALEMPTAEGLFSSSKINLDNEKELILSYPILEKVVQRLNLNLLIYAVGEIKTSLTQKYPFIIESKLKNQEIFASEYKITLTSEGVEIIDYKNDGKYYLFKSFTSTKVKHDLPFNIYNVDKKYIGGQSYLLELKSNDQIVNELKKDIKLVQVGKDSDILSINYNTTNASYARSIINELIDVYNQDGIIDRQLIHKRTIDFVNSRYTNLSQQLDSIEYSKQRFKQENNLVDLSANSALSLEKSALVETSIFTNDNQIFVTNSLLEELTKLNFELLPSNIGINSLEINTLIGSYNEKILEYKKILQSAGPNNPITLQAENLIDESRSSIIFSLETYFKQLNNLKGEQVKKFDKFDAQLTSLPLNEKLLRSINRNQQTKESLYLFLLQKREEAKVSFAVTEPSIKIVEYAISNSNPIFPKVKIIYLGAFFLAFLIPFSAIYIMFLFNTKIQTREDLEKSDFSGEVLAEIPFFEGLEEEKIFLNPTDRSMVSEAFRMLMSNVKYLLPTSENSSVMLVTSSIKGEGKTITALNLSLAFASLEKKVLLIGCDLRNPQLHKYIDEDKSRQGLVNFLVDNKMNWKEATLKKFKNSPNLEILLSGALPPNPISLINNGNLELLVNQAKEVFDYIIIDTAPTLLVADTKSIMSIVDAVLYLTRCNVTEKEILNHIEETTKSTSAQLGVILNGVGEKNAYGYSYGYGYKYAYNYGYGYGYEEDKD